MPLNAFASSPNVSFVMSSRSPSVISMAVSSFISFAAAPLKVPELSIMPAGISGNDDMPIGMRGCFVNTTHSSPPQRRITKIATDAPRMKTIPGHHLPFTSASALNLMNPTRGPNMSILCRVIFLTRIRGLSSTVFFHS